MQFGPVEQTMRKAYVIIRDSSESHRLDIEHRDLGLLTGPFFREGQRFIEALGTDDLGVLRIHRRQVEMQWLDRLPPVLEFLRSRSAKEVTVEHYERAA